MATIRLDHRREDSYSAGLRTHSMEKDPRRPGDGSNFYTARNDGC
jgi:hypothetical protein